jgi:hypothetical protein
MTIIERDDERNLGRTFRIDLTTQNVVEIHSGLAVVLQLKC